MKRANHLRSASRKKVVLSREELDSTLFLPPNAKASKWYRDYTIAQYLDFTSDK